MASYIIGALIFGYAGWALWKFIKRSKQGKCAACSVKDACGEESACQPKSIGGNRL